MRMLERLRGWLDGNEHGIMTTGAWVLAAACLGIFVYELVKCYYLLR